MFSAKELFRSVSDELIQISRRVAQYVGPAASAATVEAQPRKKQRRARKNIDFEGEERQYPRVQLPPRTACEIVPEEEQRMADFLDEFGFDVVGPEGPLGVSTLRVNPNSVFRFLTTYDAALFSRR